METASIRSTTITAAALMIVAAWKLRLLASARFLLMVTILGRGRKNELPFLSRFEQIIQEMLAGFIMA